MKKLIFAGLWALLFPPKVTAQPFQEVNYSPQKTQFTLFAPNDARKVTVRIYQEGLGGKAQKTIKMTRSGVEVYGEEYNRYADIVVYPLNDEEYAIEIKMRFLFTDYPDSIVADHWWDDSIWAKIGILN